MEEIFIDIREQNEWIKKHFNNKDLVSVYEMIGVIEDLDTQVEDLKETIKDMEEDIRENYKWVGNGESWGSISSHKPSWWN